MSEWWIIAGLVVLVLLGLWLYGRWAARNASELEQALDDLAVALEETQAAIGEALRPPLQKMVDVLQAILRL